MKLYNTLTKKIEQFVPLQTNSAGIYTCGPTVYDFAHIGNLSSYIYADTLGRTLRSSGMVTEHIMNITDVDDKTIRRSNETNHREEPKEALLNFTMHFTSLFFEDMESVGNDLSNYTFVKATDHIEHMQVIIRNLVDEGMAYISDDGVYFSIKAYKASGKTYGQLLKIVENSAYESRIDNDEYDKESAQDFALWKKRKGDEPFWRFDINGIELDGRPGWHIECSAMSTATLGLPFDIHTGGIDLIFPHHENEIAQSTGGRTEDLMAGIFFHNEHLLVNGKKMSKSLNNFYTLKDFRSKSIDPLAFRLLVLQSHYRSQSNFTWESLDSASLLLQDIRSWADLRFQNLKSPDLKAEYEVTLPSIIDALKQDLNTVEATARLICMIKRTGEVGADSEAIAVSVPTIETLFGLNLQKRLDISQFNKDSLKQRLQAREKQEWELSDAIRDELKQAGITVRDSEQGQIWSRLDS